MLVTGGQFDVKGTWAGCEKAEEANRGGTDVPDTSISDLLYTI